MNAATTIKRSQFSVGELIQHRLFDYRGVIVDVDPEFQGSEEWYDNMAKSHPPKDQPWYHVLVHDTLQNTYVAERNLESDSNTDPINHPLVEKIFSQFENGRYIREMRSN